MPNTKRYVDLSNRIKKLKKHFIPKLNELGLYSERHNDHVRAFRLLVHAEFEAYLEDIAIFVVDKANRKWKEKGKPSITVLSLLIFSQTSLDDPPSSVKDQKIITLDSKIDEAIKSFKAIKNKIGGNDGIKEKNILRLLLPIGLSIEEIDRTWLNTINSFGRERGLVAHTSHKVQDLIDPTSELQTVDIILNGMKELDAKLKKL